MPANILNADTMFPSFRDGETSDQKLDKVTNYLYMLLEQLRYSLSNLDADNFNDTGLREIAEGISRPLQTEFENELVKTAALIEGFSDEFGSQITALTQWKSGAEQSIASVTQKADANSASITLLNQWKSDASSSIAAVQTMASQNSAKISSLVQWQSTVEGDLEGLSSSVAYVEELADENGASISQIVQAVGTNGEVNAASIVAAVNAAGSSVKIDADKVDITGFVTFKSLEEDGGATINGNNVSLIGDYYGDSVSELTFYKKKYESGNTLDSLFKISTYDLGEEDENNARFALLMETYSANFDGDSYRTALKLVSRGGMSMESKRNIYMSASRYCTIDAEYNTRIVANDSYADSVMYGYDAAPGTYVFCTDGIYFIDSDGGANWIAGL